MHAYRQFVEDQMEHRKWVPADLARHSGLTKQTISNIVNDERESLSRLPEAKTVEGIARAFGMSTDKVLAHVALAMGLPVSIERADVSAVSDDELIHEITRRLKAGEQGERDTSPMNQAGVRPAEITNLEAERLRRDQGDGFNHRGQGDLDHENTGTLRPAPSREESDAAYDAPNRGAEAKEKQDRDAERPDKER